MAHITDEQKEITPDSVGDLIESLKLMDRSNILPFMSFEDCMNLSKFANCVAQAAQEAALHKLYVMHSNQPDRRY